MVMSDKPGDRLQVEGEDVFISMLEVLVLKRDKKARGVGLQNLKYGPSLIEFAHIIYSHSPVTYKKLKNSLPLPEPRVLE